MQKRMQMIGCCSGDWSVGIPSYCEQLHVDVTPSHVLVTPITHRRISREPYMIPEEGLINKSDEQITDILFPYVKDEMFEGELDLFMTKQAYAKYQRALEKSRPSDW